MKLGGENPSGADTLAMVILISPVNKLESAELFFVHVLNAANDRIWIATPYFVPDPAVMAALRLAAMRGVDVRVIFPLKSDNPVLDLATLWFVQELDGIGIRFYLHMPGSMHQKVLLVDDDVSTVASSNFDNRSFLPQFEINALMVDKASEPRSSACSGTTSRSPSPMSLRHSRGRRS